MQRCKNNNKHEYFEKLRQIIPIKSKDIASYYKIMVGFQVTPDQLEYNRANLISIAEAQAAKKAAIAKLKKIKTDKIKAQKKIHNND